MATKKEPQVTTPKNDESTSSVQDEAKNVAEVLARKTSDGRGVVPAREGDFQSFATEGVEKTELLSVKDVASEVLAGRWGVTFAIAQVKLEAAGYDVDAVWEEYNRRKAGGAPSAF